MSEEKLRILQMIQDGKISATEGMELLKALEDSEPRPEVKSSSLKNRFLRVRVNNEDGTTKVNVNIPLGLLKIASKFATVGMNYIPESARQEMAKKGIDLSQLDPEEIIRIIEEGLVDGKLVDVEATDPQEGPVKVEVYVD